MNNLFQLIDQWQNGSLPENTIILGKELFFWARTGELIQLFAGLFVIAEIIGEDRIRKFGESLKNGHLINLIGEWNFKIFNAIIQYIQRSALKVSSFTYSSGLSPTVGASSIKTVTLVLLGAFAFFVTSMIQFLQNAQNSPAVFVWLVNVFLASILIIAIVIFIMFLISVIGSLMDFFIFRPTAYVLSKPYINELFKVVALLLFVLGFIFSFISM